MKILHTGDWHIGKLVHGVHLTEDQKHMLNELIELIKREKPDVMLVSGDIYDRSVPPIQAVDLLDEILTEIVVHHKVKIIAIAGNHDSPDRVGFASKILRDNGLFITGHIEKDIVPITLEDEYGPVDFYPIPYAEPAVVREIYGDEFIKSHDEAMKAVLEGISKKRNANNQNANTRSVCVAHAYLTGTESLETSESVRPLSIGGSEFVDVSYFEKFDYVALGHLHRPQKVKHNHIRYAGSLMKYSFSEALQRKSVAMVELNKDGSIEVELHELTPIRDMRVIKGHLENLVDVGVYGETNVEDYIMAVLTDEGELIDPINSLRAIYPNILKLEKESSERQTGDDQTSASADFKQKNPLELFEEFYENISGDVFVEEKSDIVAKVINDIKQKVRNS